MAARREKPRLIPLIGRSCGVSYGTLDPRRVYAINTDLYYKKYNIEAMTELTTTLQNIAIEQ